VDAERINRLAREPLGEHLFLRDQAPLIVSVGSLTKRKDMRTLIKAFAIVKEQRQAHLVIIGKGPEAHELKSLISDLGLDTDVHLPGFDVNPYKWMAAAAVFVSSSTGEGFPNAVAEALALGLSIVATDCPGDTAELLGYGKWGRLVPVGDPERMADAILAALDDPNPPDGRIRAADFSPASAVGAYLKILLPGLGTEAPSLRQSP
jgi:glycosyltransferase involved in cell wall biosynthesis